MTRTTEPTLASSGRITAGKSGSGMSIWAREEAEHPQRATKPTTRAGPKAETHPRRRNQSKRGGCMADRQACPAIRSTVWSGQNSVLACGIAPEASAVMLRPMDWQKIAALCVVGITLGLFFWARWGPRRLGSRGGGCGCSGGASANAGPRLIVQGRRGERPQVLLR